MVKTADDLYENKKKKNFFKNEEERNLWIRLNAEHIRHWENVVRHNHKKDLGSIDEPHSCMWISKNQLAYDEYMENAPRMSLAELSSMSHDELLRLSEIRNEEKIKSFVETYEDDFLNIL